MSKEDLKSKEAILKLQQLVDKIDVGMLCTYPDGSSYVHAIPMSR